jgi:hypothetical protein
MRELFFSETFHHQQQAQSLPKYVSSRLPDHQEDVLMAISRRKFVKAGALVFLSAGIPSVVLGATNNKRGATASGLQSPPPHGAATGSLRFFSLATLKPHLNSSFRIKAESGTVRLKLAQVSDLKARNDNAHKLPGGECFSLLFVGAKGLEQQVYTVEHSALGTFDLLLVPIGKNRGGQHYQAVFTRL